MLTLGVDPGKLGAIAAVGGDGGPWVRPIPLIRGRKGSRAEYDLDGVVALLRRAGFARYRERTVQRWGELCAFLELTAPLPPKVKQGTNANYHRGFGRGFLEGVLRSLRIPYTLVPPRKWQAEMLEGTTGDDTKQRAIVAAGRLFPGVSLMPTERSRKPSDGMADALLIAEYGRRRVNGGS